MGAMIALAPDSVISQKSWDPHDIPTVREGVFRWAKNTSYGTLMGIGVGIVMHFRKHPMDWQRVRTVKFTGHMDRRNRWYPPVLGRWRSYSLRTQPQMKDMWRTGQLWGMRVGTMFMVCYGLETTLCCVSRRPFHTSSWMSFVSGCAGGYVLALSDLVVRKHRIYSMIGMGILFMLGANYDRNIWEMKPGQLTVNQEKEAERIIQMTERMRDMSPREKEFQMKMQAKMEKLLKVSGSPADIHEKGDILGDGADNQWVFDLVGTLRERCAKYQPAIWADPATKAEMEIKRLQKIRKEEQRIGIGKDEIKFTKPGFN